MQRENRPISTDKEEKRLLQESKVKNTPLISTKHKQKRKLISRMENVSQMVLKGINIDYSIDDRLVNQLFAIKRRAKENGAALN